MRPKRRKKGRGDSDQPHRKGWMSIRDALTDSLAHDAMREFETGADGAGFEEDRESMEDPDAMEGSFLAQLEQALNEDDEIFDEAHEKLSSRSSGAELGGGHGVEIEFLEDSIGRPFRRPPGSRRRKRKVS